MTIDEKIAALKSDIVQMNAVQTVIHNLAESNNEQGEGLSMLLATEVLLREAISRYEEEIETLEGPEAA
jgi:citrate lyase synthetase